MNEEEFEALADGGWKYEVESLRQQLAAAIAACKLKDEALAAWGNLTTTEWLRMVAKALAIQPDDSALKSWIGEPVAYIDDHHNLRMGKVRITGPLYKPKELK